MSPWQEFISRIDKARKRLGCERTGAWFRGHGDRSWQLSPTLLRATNGLDREQNLYYQFISRGGPLVASGSSSWEILSSMRHHGVATRLLDWSESLAVAIFFATRNPKNPCIWVTNPYKLNKKTLGHHWVLNLELDARLHYDKSFVLKSEPWPYDLPVAVDSPWRNNRLSAQKGYFTLHGNDSRALDLQQKDIAIPVDIPKDALVDCEQFLESSGVNEYTLFPDLDGLARWLNYRYLIMPDPAAEKDADNHPPAPAESNGV